MTGDDLNQYFNVDKDNGLFLDKCIEIGFKFNNKHGTTLGHLMVYILNRPLDDMKYYLFICIDKETHEVVYDMYSYSNLSKDDFYYHLLNITRDSIECREYIDQVINNLFEAEIREMEINKVLFDGYSESFP